MSSTKILKRSAKLEPQPLLSGVRQHMKVTAKLDNKHVINSPIDFSFQEIKSLNDLREREPNDDIKMRRALHHSLVRVYGKGLADKKQPKLPVTAVKLCYNQLTTLEGLEEALEGILEKPKDLMWLDVSYNNLTTIDNVLSRFPKLSMLYLHGNNIRDLNEIKKLKCLPLKKLTLHGNQNVIDKGTRFLRMVKGSIKTTKADTFKALQHLPASRIKEQCILLKKFNIHYVEGEKDEAIRKITNFIFADITNQLYRPPASAETSMEDKKSITLEGNTNYRY
ncbi:hypothetical protein AAMO2058_001159100 [Amorphochlora amoebiformis]